MRMVAEMLTPPFHIQSGRVDKSNFWLVLKLHRSGMFNRFGRRRDLAKSFHFCRLRAGAVDGLMVKLHFRFGSRGVSC